MTVCSPSVQSGLLQTLGAVQAAGASSMTCAQWSAVASVDAACLPSVRAVMLALVANATVVPSPYQPALTAQVNALLTSPCPSPPPPMPRPPPAIPSALLTAVSSTLAQVRSASLL